MSSQPEEPDDGPQLAAMVVPECNCDNDDCTIKFLHSFKMRVIKDEEGETYVNYEDFDTVMVRINRLMLGLHQSHGMPPWVASVVESQVMSLVCTMRYTTLNTPGAVRAPITIADVPDQIPDDWADQP